MMNEPVSDDPVCAFCGQDESVQTICGKLHRVKLKDQVLLAHHKCMQYSSNLVQYKFKHFGGFDVDEVLLEKQRGKKLKCHICKEKKKKNFNRLTGATAGCALSTCRRTFHFYCAYHHAITKRLEEGEEPKKVVLYRVFCTKDHEVQHLQSKQYRLEWQKALHELRDTDPEEDSRDNSNEANESESEPEGWKNTSSHVSETSNSPSPVAESSTSEENSLTARELSSFTKKTTRKKHLELTTKKGRVLKTDSKMSKKIKSKQDVHIEKKAKNVKRKHENKGDKTKSHFSENTAGNGNLISESDSEDSFQTKPLSPSTDSDKSTEKRKKHYSHLSRFAPADDDDDCLPSINSRKLKECSPWKNSSTKTTTAQESHLQKAGKSTGSFSNKPKKSLSQGIIQIPKKQSPDLRIYIGKHSICTFNEKNPLSKKRKYTQDQSGSLAEKSSSVDSSDNEFSQSPVTDISVREQSVKQKSQTHIRKSSSHSESDSGEDFELSQTYFRTSSQIPSSQTKKQDRKQEDEIKIGNTLKITKGKKKSSGVDVDVPNGSRTERPCKKQTESMDEGLYPHIESQEKDNEKNALRVTDISDKEEAAKTDYLLIIAMDDKDFEPAAKDVCHSEADKYGINFNHVYVWTNVSPTSLPPGCMLSFIADVAKAVNLADWTQLNALLLDAATIQRKLDDEYHHREKFLNELGSRSLKMQTVNKMVELILVRMKKVKQMNDVDLGMFTEGFGVNYFTLCINDITDSEHYIRDSLRKIQKLFVWKAGTTVASFESLDRVQRHKFMDCELSLLKDWFKNGIQTAHKVHSLPMETVFHAELTEKEKKFVLMLKSTAEELVDCKNFSKHSPVILFLSQVNKTILNFQPYLEAVAEMYATVHKPRPVICIIPVTNLMSRTLPEMTALCGKVRVQFMSTFNPSYRPVLFVIMKISHHAK